MAYNYTCERFIKRKMGVNGQNFFRWMKPGDSENLTKIPKLDKQTSLKEEMRYTRNNNETTKFDIKQKR